MATERTCLNCKYLHRSKYCPHIDDESIRKADKNEVLKYLNDNDFKHLEKLCMECSQFESVE